MLHIIVNTHNPESCAFRGEAEGEALTGAFASFTEGAQERGMTVHGTWVSRPSHEIFVLVDAPDAHVIERALLDSGLVGRTHSRVSAVLTMEEAFGAD